MAKNIKKIKVGATTYDIYDATAARSSHTHSFDTITNRGEAFLSWGGKNFSGSYGPIDAAMVPELGANRLAFMPANAVTIEYSRDGGSTWTDYGPTDPQKADLFNGRGASFTIGKATSGAGNIATNKYQLRVNIYTDTGRVYTVLNKFVIYLSTSGTNNNWCTIRARTQSDYTANNDKWTTFADKIRVSGWSGYNVINTSGITTYGNTASTQYGHIQFIFGCDTGSTNNSYPGLQINKIFGFGGVGWTTPSTMAKTGHMYTYDSSQNVIFPEGVSAKSFTEGGTSLANKYIAKSLTSAKGDMIYASAASTPARLGIGSNGQFLSVANGVPTWVNNPNTNTWRKVQLNGTDKLGTGINTNPLNIKAGSNMTITESNGTFTFAATAIKTLKTDNTAAQAASAGEAISGSGTINLHKISKTGSYSDLNDKPTNLVTTNTEQTITGTKHFNAITANTIGTGSDANNYFQSQKFRGEGDANTYYHAVDFGYAGHNQVDFYEYGGNYNFYINTQANTDSRQLLFGINPSGIKIPPAAGAKVLGTNAEGQVEPHSLGIADISSLQSTLDGKVNSSSLATVAKTGSYNDLNNKPTIPDISNLVPYLGAISDVNLGNHSLLISDQTSAASAMVKVSGKQKTENDTSVTIKPFRIELAGVKKTTATLDAGALIIADDNDTYKSYFNKLGVRAQLKKDTDGDGQLDTTYYSIYEYDKIRHNGKNLLLPEKDGTIALTSDLPSKLSQMDNDANYVKSTDNIDADTLAGKTYQEILNLIDKKQDSSNFLSLIQNLSTFYTGYLHTELVNVGTDMNPSYTAVAKIDPLPVATSKLYGIVKLGSDTAQKVNAEAVSSTASRTYAIQRDSNGHLVVNVPWISSSYTLPDASSSTVGGVKAYFDAIKVGSGNWELWADIRQGSNTLYIRAGQFQQTSGSGTTTSEFTFKRAMSTMGGRASYVAVILGDSYGQSTSGGYMGSLAVDSSDYSGCSYRASNGEKGHVYYIAIGKC